VIWFTILALSSKLMSHELRDEKRMFNKRPLISCRVWHARCLWIFLSIQNRFLPKQQWPYHRTVVLFYSIHVNKILRNLNTTTWEILSLVETFSLPIVHSASFYTRQKNLVIYTVRRTVLYCMLNTERVIQWRSIIDKHTPESNYLTGEHHFRGRCSKST
jgi:hypothetical protein